MKYSNAILLAILMFLLGIVAGSVITQIVYQEEAINRGFAIYNPTNATFQWKTVDNKPW